MLELGGSDLLSLFLLLLLLLGSCTPVRVVDRGILQQGREDEDETHDLRDYNNVLRAAFTFADPKSKKMTLMT